MLRNESSVLLTTVQPAPSWYRGGTHRLHHAGNVLPVPSHQHSISLVKASLCIAAASCQLPRQQVLNSTLHSAFSLAICCFSSAKLSSTLLLLRTSYFSTSASSLERRTLQAGMENHWAASLQGCQNTCLITSSECEDVNNFKRTEVKQLFQVHSVQSLMLALIVFCNYTKWLADTLLTYIMSAFFLSFSCYPRNQGLFAFYPLVSLKCNTSYHTAHCTRLSAYLGFLGSFQRWSLCWLQELSAINCF